MGEAHWLDKCFAHTGCGFSPLHREPTPLIKQKLHLNSKHLNSKKNKERKEGRRESRGRKGGREEGREDLPMVCLVTMRPMFLHVLFLTVALSQFGLIGTLVVPPPPRNSNATDKTVQLSTQGVSSKMSHGCQKL